MLETDKQTEFISPSQNPAEPPAQHPQHGRGGLRTGAIIGLTLLLVVIFVIGGFAGWVFANAKSSAAGTTASTTLGTAQEAVVAKVKPSVVEVYVTLSQGAALGSGVIIDPRGYIVTNNHVVNGAHSIQVVFSNGTKEAAQLTGTDTADDLAV